MTIRGRLQGPAFSPKAAIGSTSRSRAMRVAVVSDLHANLHAVEAIDRDLQAQRADEIWCLGDVVGYGAYPRETLQWVRDRADVLVKGNHDEAVATGDVAGFNQMAASAARAHAQILTPVERSEIFAWRLEDRRSPRAGEAVVLVHGSPDEPLHEYVQPHDARLGLKRWSGVGAMVFLGHTHRPFAAFRAGKTGADAWSAKGFVDHVSEPSPSGDHPFALINPGSVGQPRDGDPRASYAIVDFERRAIELRRVEYDVESAAQAILKRGLDQMLALRLYEGR